jgi:hypothetical protein
MTRAVRTALVVVGVIAVLVVAAGSTLTVQEKCRLQTQPANSTFNDPERTASTCSWRVIRRWG